MKIYDKYPDRVTACGRTYKIDLDFRTVMKVLEIQEMDELEPIDKQEIMVRYFLRGRCPRDPAKQAEILRAILALFPQSEKTGERYIDFEQDAALIRSAFFRMGIDLTKDRLHFFRFMELLGDIPRDTALAHVIEIRQRPIPEPTKYNSKQIEALMKAKAKVAIKYQDGEREKRFADSLKNCTVLKG